MDRARQYGARLSISVKPAPPLTQPANLLSNHLPSFLSSSAGAVFLAPAPKEEDLIFVTVIAARCAEANESVEVCHIEDLVVPFGV